MTILTSHSLLTQSTTDNVNIKYLVFIFLLMPYLGTGGPAYIIAMGCIILYTTYKTTYYKTPMFFLLFAVIIYILKFFQPDNFTLIRYFQVYFGFIIFYIMFSAMKGAVNKETIGIMMALFIISEAILINTVVDPHLLGNFPSFNGVIPDDHLTSYFGFYRRPYGYGTNASMTSTMLVVMYSISDRTKTKRLLATAILLSASITGYGLFLIALFLVSKRKVLITIVLGSLLIAIQIILQQIDVHFAYRVSPQFVWMIIEYAFEQNLNLLRPDDYSILFGTNYLIDGEAIYLTDNGMAPFFYTNGLLLTFAYLGTPFWQGSYKSKIPFILLFVGIFHYPAIFTMPGQVLFALLLTNKLTTIDAKSGV
jgi:hypothetical protein